jgi:hypothetical protein
MLVNVEMVNVLTTQIRDKTTLCIDFVSDFKDRKGVKLLFESFMKDTSKALLETCTGVFFYKTYDLPPAEDARLKPLPSAIDMAPGLD